MLTKIDELLDQLDENSEESGPSPDPELESLHSFIKRGEVDIFRKKLTESTNVEYKDSAGRTMLIAAVFYQVGESIYVRNPKSLNYWSVGQTNMLWMVTQKMLFTTPSRQAI